MRIRNMAGLLAVALLAAFMPHERTAPNRWALIIGISDYLHFGDEIGGDLPGAAPDALRMRDVLVARWGFSEDRIRLVVDHDATRERIIRELSDWLPSVVRPGDHVVFYFAGHGSQTWSDDPDEPTGLDQTICPTDVMRGDPAMDIRDKELGGYLRALPTENVVAILDNCHAGTGTRELTPHMRPRFLDRNVAGTARPAGAPLVPAGVPPARHDNVLEIAAAQSHEVAVDAAWPNPDGAGPIHGGAFTTHFVRNLWRVPRRASYHDVFSRTVEDMKRDRFAQQPMIQLGGRDVTPADRTPAFAVDGDASVEDGFVPVLEVRGDEVRLGGGSAAGITVGSVFRAGQSALEVTAVGAADATARVVAGGRVAAGTPARLDAYVYPERTLVVSVAGLADATRSALSQALRGTPGIRLVPGARDFSHLLVRPADGGGYMIIGLDGAIRQRLPGGTQSPPVTALRDALRVEAGAHQLASLENPAHAFPLEFGFAAGRTAFRLGEDIDFHVTPGRDGYLTIVDIGVDGLLVVLFPNELERDNRVRAGQRVVLPTPTMDLAFEAQRPGRGIVRAFLTERPLVLPLTVVAEPSVDMPFAVAEPEEAGTIVRALYGAVGGSPDGTGPLPVGSWATASVVYTIAR